MPSRDIKLKAYHKHPYRTFPIKNYLQGHMKPPVTSVYNGKKSSVTVRPLCTTVIMFKTNYLVSAGSHL
jgi:hypothetical protein